MSKIYEAPTLEFEQYELDASIASHCYWVVKIGPELGSHAVCEGYDGPSFSNYSLRPGSYNVMFYDDVEMCDCYTTGGNQGFWTS